MKIDPNLKASVGIDIGHSKVKWGFSFSDKPDIHHIGDFPTVVMDYFEHSSEDTKKSIEKDVVALNGKKYFIGKTALLQGAASDYTGQEKDWIKKVEHDVLILAAWQAVQENIKQERGGVYPSGYVIVFGLPTSLFAAQKDELLERANNLLKPLINPKQQVKIIIKAQSEAPLSCIAFEPNGSLSGHNIGQEDWGIVEIGHFTTDYTLFFGGQIIDRASTSSVGIKDVYKNLTEALASKYPVTLNGFIANVVEKKEIFVKGSMHNFEEEVKKAASSFIKNTAEKMKTVFDEQKDLLQGIVLAGGGANLVFDELKKEYPNLYLVPNIDPRYVVLESFIRLGLHYINVKNILKEVPTSQETTSQPKQVDKK